MLKYGTDKPDLRNPLVIADVSEVFAREDVTFNAFKNVIKSGGVVRAIPATGAASQPRSFFDKLNDWARTEGAPGLGYVVFEEEGGKIVGKGPIAKFIPDEAQAAIREKAGIKAGDAVFFSAGDRGQGGRRSPARRACASATSSASATRTSSPSAGSSTSRNTSGTRTRRRSTSRTTRSPWPNIDHDAFMALDPSDKDTILKITAFQYDMVCNGYEMASGAIRNHRPDRMVKAFEIAGYGEKEVMEQFGGMYRAFQYGAPPHGGMAAGIDRIVMLLCGAQNLREITLFPMNQRAEDLLLGAPSEVTPKQLRELHIRLNLPEK